MELYLVIMLIVLTATASWCLARITCSARLRHKINYMLDALEDKEYNFKFNEGKFSERKINRTLNRLKTIFNKEREEIISQEKYFSLMLEHVRTGIVVIEDNGNVVYCNSTALSIIGTGSLGHIRQVKNIDNSLYEGLLNVSDKSELRIEHFNECSKAVLSLTASKAEIHNRTVRIVAINNISNELAENEQQSWSRLTRVLTHEIMNTVSPITSLSDALLEIPDTDPTIRNGLVTISQSSKDLMEFVKSYRNLTRIAMPVKKVFFVKDLAERVITLTHEQAQDNGTVCRYSEKSEDIILYADEGQISQILINIVRNAIQAEATQVCITADINSLEQTVISVSNNGRPISRESRDEIFIPFYTTKQDGTGIGLSISRQIMSLHNGSIILAKSDETSTVFTLTFR